MKKYSRVILLLSISVLLFCIVPQLASATGDPGDPTGQCGDPDVDCPVDGGVVLLIAAGIAYGFKKIRSGRKKNLVTIRCI